MPHASGRPGVLTETHVANGVSDLTLAPAQSVIAGEAKACGR
jgi:hypothetical protein